MSEKIVTVASYPYSRAQLLKGRLESQGIDCFLSNVNMIQGDFGTGVRVMIKEEDMEKAMRIIREIHEEYGEEKQQTLERLKAVRKILVPVDFSDTSVNACRFAIGMAEKLKAEVHLLNIWFNPVVTSEPYTQGFSPQIGSGGLLLNLEQDARKRIKQLADELKEEIRQKNISKVSIDYTVMRGSPEDIITEFADQYDPGVIVMGMKGRDDSLPGIIGSVTFRVMKKAEVPLLVIPEKSEFHGIQYVNRVMFATGFDESDYAALHRLMALVRPFEMKIFCVHVAEFSDNPMNRAEMENLKKHFSEKYPGAGLICDIIEQKDVFQALEDYIGEMEIHLIAMTTHKRDLLEKIFHPSLTRKMLFHTSVPLLVFHS